MPSTRELAPGPVGEGVRRVLVPGERTGGRFALVESEEVRGAAAPRHLHREEDEVVCVLDGEIAVELDGERFVVAAGGTAFLPRLTDHAIAAVSPRARLLTLLSPAGFERHHGDRLHIERLVADAARFGCEITGPPPVA